MGSLHACGRWLVRGGGGVGGSDKTMRCGFLNGGGREREGRRHNGR